MLESDLVMLSTIVDRYRQYGVKTVAFRLVSRFFRVVFYSKAFDILCSESDTTSQGNDAVDIVVITEKDRDLAATRRFSSPLEQGVINKVTSDSVLFMARFGDEFCGYGFVQTEGVYRFANRAVVVPRGLAVLKSLYIFPSFRGRGLAKDLNIARVRWIHQTLERPAVVLVENDNLYARKNLELAGMRHVGVTRYARLLGAWSRVSTVNYATDLVLRELLDSFLDKGVSKRDVK